MDWAQLKVATTGSKFCDLCTSLRNNLYSINKADVRHKVLIDLLEEHHSNARKEHDSLRKCLEEACHQDDSQQHVIFDFLRKVLMPRLIRQPEQLCFLTGLQFDLF